MKKYILLKVEADAFKVLKSMKLALWRKDKKFLNWEDFLVDWVLHVFKLLHDKDVEEAVTEIAKELKPEYRKAFKNYIHSFLEMRLLFYQNFVMDIEELYPQA